ncbi:hypothetical protein CDD80_1345 [Ophiocordyceps camponoti-rufipedis]|uniref:V-type proton ATPase subunit G n=1 Tax=Ophiocordyceps camponoti-rufipedis TaxID=2004952 RepID=A0A2C5Z6M9_9HYPO|nr:hypothetical protein CDD80_1345 [Ophiocordyceps camponoti-rufipedis]
MAYAQWIILIIANALNNRDIRVQNATVDWGKFWQGSNRDNEIKPWQVNQIVTAPGTAESVKSCGRSDSSSGTAGSLDLYDGDTRISHIWWNCPWGSKSNEFSALVDDSVRALYHIHVTDHALDAGSLGAIVSAQNSAGIQTLLDAERDASKIVQKDRTKRIKEARDEAKKEITNYKTKKDEEFKKFEAEHGRGNKEAEDEAAKEAEQQIQVIKNAGQKSRDAVVKNLLEAVFDVKPVPPSAA